MLDSTYVRDMYVMSHQLPSPVLALSVSRNATLAEQRAQGQLSAHARDKPIIAHLSSHVTFKLEQEKIYLVVHQWRYLN